MVVDSAVADSAVGTDRIAGAFVVVEASWVADRLLLSLLAADKHKSGVHAVVADHRHRLDSPRSLEVVLAAWLGYQPSSLAAARKMNSHHLQYCC